MDRHITYYSKVGQSHRKGVTAQARSPEKRTDGGVLLCCIPAEFSTIGMKPSSSSHHLCSGAALESVL